MRTQDSANCILQKLKLIIFNDNDELHSVHPPSLDFLYVNLKTVVPPEMSVVVAVAASASSNQWLQS